VWPRRYARWAQHRGAGAIIAAAAERAAGIFGAIIAGALIAAAIREGRAHEDDIARCEEDFYSFDPRTGTYINRYGEERCALPAGLQREIKCEAAPRAAPRTTCVPRPDGACPPMVLAPFSPHRFGESRLTRRGALQWPLGFTALLVEVSSGIGDCAVGDTRRLAVRGPRS
jgi:hypothetical protein